MTPTALRAYQDARVHGEFHAGGSTADGLVWEVRTHPRTGGYRITVALPWVALRTHAAPLPIDSEASHGDAAILGRFQGTPDPLPFLAEVRGWKTVRAVKVSGKRA